MKKGVMILLVLTFSLFLVSAQQDTISQNGSLTESQKIDLAYQCLQDKVEDKSCSSLSIQEKIFTSLAIGECRDELISDSRENECWPKSNCDIETTSKAIIALEDTSFNTEAAKNWLNSRKGAPSELSWFLQIASSDATTCTISYGGEDYTTSIDSEDKFSSSAGPCLSPSQGNLWLLVSPSCYDQEFTVSCDAENFLSNLLYKKTDSQTIYVSEDTESATSGGTTTAKVVSYCFKDGTSCSYEGTLWGALALDKLGEDYSSYLPYLTTLYEDNPESIPESFLFHLTDSIEFRNELLLKRVKGLWDLSGQKFYDTAVAMLSLEYLESADRSETIDALLKSQGSDGCWGNSIRDTGFLLYSIWPDSSRTPNDGGGGSGKPDCEDSGYFCMSRASCDGSVLSDYSCSSGGLVICCDTERELETCQSQSGSVCSDEEVCTGETVSASGLSSGESCCVGPGSECREREEPKKNTCSAANGICSSFSCEDGYKEDNTGLTCGNTGEICCVIDNSKGGSSLWLWIIIFAILIGLVTIGIIYRGKLQLFFERFKSKFGKSSGSNTSPRGPPGLPPSGSSLPMPSPGRFMPPQRPMPRPMPPRGLPPQQKPKGEIDDVLKKLKEMGK